MVARESDLDKLAIVGKVISPTNYGNFPGVIYAISIVKRSAWCLKSGLEYHYNWVKELKSIIKRKKLTEDNEQLINL